MSSCWLPASALRLFLSGARAELVPSQDQLQLLERELGQGGGQGAGALVASGETALHRAFARVCPFAVPVPKTRLQSDSKQIL